MITVKEATLFFRSHEVKCDEQLVGEWMDKSPVGRALRDSKDEIDEWDMYNFSDWCRVYGTAYENGIDDQTKITRLLEEVAYIKQKNEELQKGNFEIISKLDILPF
jgi:hypothetical protein